MALPPLFQEGNMRVLSSSQMYKVEQAQADMGISFTRLMENAGAACARAIKQRCESMKCGKKICVICGNGKNGGDGFVIARKLSQDGYNVSVVLACGLPAADDAVLMREKMHDIGTVSECLWEDSEGKKAVETADVIIDAIFGIGYRYRKDERMESVFEAVNNAKGFTVCIDMPSGCESDSADLPSVCVKADVTLAITCLKPAHVFKPARCVCGDIVRVDIGISQEAFSAAEGQCINVLSVDEAKELFPRKDVMGNKGTFGHALSICGSKNMQGAAVLAAQGALRCGVGLVTAAFPDAAYPAIAPKLTEQLMLPMPSNSAGTFSSAAISELVDRTSKASAVLIGCGVGLNLEIKDLVGAVVRNCKKPIIVDADGINAVACDINMLREAEAPVLITPHPGEMSRLTGKSISDIEADRVKTACDFAREYNINVLLKGASTVIVSSGGEKIYVNTTGNPGMAKGGSGDLLSGIILSFAAQGVGLFESAVLGAYIHGAAGDAAANCLSMAAMTPCDCIEALPGVLRKYE